MSQDFSVSALITGIYGNLCEYYRFLGHSSLVELCDAPDLSWIITGIRDPFLNCIFRTRLNSDDVDNVIPEILAHFMARDVPLIWMTGPEARPPDLGRYLEGYGLKYSADWLGMAAAISAVSESLSKPSSLTISDVQNDDSLEQWVRAYTTGFSLAEFHDRYFAIEAGLGLSPDLPRQHLIGLQNERPVASSTLFFSAGVAGIYNVTTIPEVRRRGIGTAMMLACLRLAGAVGYRTAILHASSMGSNLYRRLGFKGCCSVDAYVLT